MILRLKVKLNSCQKTPNKKELTKLCTTNTNFRKYVVTYLHKQFKYDIANRIASECKILLNFSYMAAVSWAYLKPVLISLPFTIVIIHFLGKGFATQYRNKTMFFNENEDFHSQC